MDIPVFKCVIDPALDSELQVTYIALVDKPAIEKNFIAFNQTKMKFSVDTEKRIVSGPAMIADMLIYRNIEPIGEFYTVFDKETIFQIALKFFKKGLVHNFNIMHDKDQTTPNLTLYESFITDSARGVMPMKGYEDVAEGSWFISVKAEDDSAWEKVKNGELKGFSVEGLFQQIPMMQEKLNSEAVLEKLAALLSMWDGKE